MVIPVQPIVIIFDFSIFPTVTIVGGRGATSAPPRHFIFAISDLPFSLHHVGFVPSEITPNTVYVIEINEGVFILSG